MGLDTISYSHIEAMPADWEPPRDDYGQIDYDQLYDMGIHRAHTYSDFPRAMDGLEGGHQPDPTQRGAIGSRWYKLTNRGPCTSSSYTGHGRYRQALVDSFWAASGPFDEIDPDQHNQRPFVDLIWFADNEGLLGPEACARLAADYDAHPELPGDEWMTRLHRLWSAAAHHAAGTGAIRFS